MNIQADALVFEMIRANRRDTGHYMANTSADASYTTYSVAGPFWTIGDADYGTLDDADTHVIG